MTLATTAVPNEPTVKINAAQLRNWMDGYHRKLAQLSKRSEEAKAAVLPTNGGRRAGATSEAALLALNGLSLNANETGFVTRINPTGKIVQLQVGQEERM